MKIVITGSSSGIGRALAERLLTREHDVWGVARGPQDDLAARYPGRFRASVCDVARWAQVESTADVIRDVWPHHDALVTCAGVQGAMGRATQIDPLAWSDTVRINVDGTFFPIRAFFPVPKDVKRRTKIVCFSGGGATQGRPNFSAYGAAKTAIVRLVETIAAEEAEAKLDINAIAPGGINTRLTDEVIALGPEIVGEKEYQAALRQKAEGGASMDRALDLVEWLLSSESDGTTGRLISARWDPWQKIATHYKHLAGTDVFTLRRITPQDRDLHWE